MYLLLLSATEILLRVHLLPHDAPKNIENKLPMVLASLYKFAKELLLLLSTVYIRTEHFHTLGEGSSLRRTGSWAFVELFTYLG